MKTIPVEVLKEFGVHGNVTALTGGQGESFLTDGIVLKPAVKEADWTAEIFNSIKENGFRVPRPVPTKDGRWTSGGWCAWKFIPGRHDTSRVEDILIAGRKFHVALKGLPRPGFLDQKDDPWAVANRMVWGEIPFNCHPLIMEQLNKLTELLKPLSLPSQLIHADLIGNVLFEEGLPPGIIDFSPSWRPPEYALAIVIADALDWNGANESVLRFVSDIPDFFQLLARAEMFRIAVYEGFHLSDEQLKKNLLGHTKTLNLLRENLKN